MFLTTGSPIFRAELDIIDAHAHAFPDSVAPHAMGSLCDQSLWHEMRNHHDGTLAGLLTSMDAAGIRRAILCSVPTKPTQVEKITNWSVQVASDRIIPFASIHPDYEHPEREVERIAGLGLRGLKFHPQYMHCAVDDLRCLRIARAAASAGLSFTLHAGYHPCFPKHDDGSPRRLRRLHDAVPDLRIVACHLGGMGDWQGVVDCIVGGDIYLETSFAPSWCPRDVWEIILARHDPHRIARRYQLHPRDCQLSERGFPLYIGESRRGLVFGIGPGGPFGERSLRGDKHEQAVQGWRHGDILHRFGHSSADGWISPRRTHRHDDFPDTTSSAFLSRPA